MREMAIQFLCPSCAQPIEVDSAWAQKTVACPYCRGTVNAPSASTLPPPTNLPIASPLTPPTGWSAPIRTTNPLALVAFGLTVLMVVLLTVSTYTLAAHSLEFEELTQEVQKHGSNPASQFSAWMDYANAHGGQVPVWMMVAGLLELCGLAVSVAALICGLLALRHPARRGLAVASVIACSAVLGLVLLNLFRVFA